ncbi:MAG: acetyl-CoA carboxylase biotin carboxyl carrier protein subunit [Anaerolineae bacterium]
MEIRSPLAGTVFRIFVSPGDAVSAGDTLVILESMKMEVNVDAIFDGTVAEIVRQEGDVVQADDILVLLDD